MAPPSQVHHRLRSSSDPFHDLNAVYRDSSPRSTPRPSLEQSRSAKKLPARDPDISRSVYPAYSTTPRETMAADVATRPPERTRFHRSQTSTPYVSHVFLTTS